jgi:HK97 family phage prohead protease
MDRKLELRYHQSKVQFRENNIPGSIGTLSGYITVWNSDSVDLGGFHEQIQKGAFTNTLKTNYEEIVCLKNHNTDILLGRLSSGTLKLTEDETGLAYELLLPDTEEGRSLKTMTEREDYKGCSFGFKVIGEEWSEREDGAFCLITEVDLFEVSVAVSFPAYPASTMQVRKLQENRNKELKEKHRKELNRMKDINRKNLTCKKFN